MKSSPGHEGTFTPDSGRTEQNLPGVAVKGHTANSGRQTRKGAQQVPWGSERPGSRRLPGASWGGSVSVALKDGQE